MKDNLTNHTLKKAAISGGKWNGMANIIQTALQFVQFAILGRLLCPDDFGLMAMVMVVIMLGQTSSDAGISNAIIQNQNVTSKQLSSLYWLNFFSSIFIFIVLYVCTPLLALYFNDDRLINLFHISLCCFLIIPIGQQFDILFRKELMFKITAYIEIISSVVETVSSIILAFLGFGVLSLVIGKLGYFTSKSLTFFFLGFKRWRHSFHFKLSDLKAFLNFGIYQVLSNYMFFLYSKLDKIIIAPIFGAEILGFYELASRLTLQPIQKIAPIIKKIAFPVFSKIQNDPVRIKSAYYSVMKLNAYLLLPILAVLYATSPFLVPLIFGEKWTSSIILVQILSIATMFRSIGVVNGPFLLSIGKANYDFFRTFLLAFVMLPALLVSAYFSDINIVAITILFVFFVLIFSDYFLFIRSNTKSTLIEYIMNFIKPVLICFLLIMILTLSKTVIPMANSVMMFCIQVTAGILIYIAGIVFIAPKDFHYFKGLLFKPQKIN